MECENAGLGDREALCSDPGCSDSGFQTTNSVTLNSELLFPYLLNGGNQNWPVSHGLL